MKRILSISLIQVIIEIEVISANLLLFYSGWQGQKNSLMILGNPPIVEFQAFYHNYQSNVLTEIVEMN